jgi:type I restriction enzyme S subunit
MSNAVIEFEGLPESWEMAQLGELVQPTRPRIKPEEKPSLPFLGMDHIEAHTMRQLGSVPASTMKSSSVHFQPGDVLYGRLRPYLNKVFLPTFEGLCSAEFIVFPESKALSNKYLQYFLNWTKFVSYANSLNSGDRPRVKFEQLASCKVPVPPLEQQKRIVAKIEELFSHIDAGIAALKKSKQLLKQYRQSVLKAAVTGELTKQWREDNKDKLEPASQLLERILQERRQKWETQQLEQFKAKGKVPKDDGWKVRYKEPEDVVLTELPEMPEEWIWARLDSITFVGTGMSVSKSRKVTDPIDVAYLRVANVQRGYLVLDKMKTMPIEKNRLSGLELQEWDVLYNEGGDIDKLGRGWIWENQVQPCITQNHVFRASPYIKERSHSVFLSIWGNTFGQDYFIDTGKQTTNLASINKGVLSAFPTPLPPLEEQKKIIEVVEEKLASIERLANETAIQLIKAEQNKQSILASAFSGQL